MYGLGSGKGQCIHIFLRTEKATTHMYTHHLLHALDLFYILREGEGEGHDQLLSSPTATT